MPSPTDSTWPTSETSASSPKLAICDLRMAEISAARISMAVLGSLQGETEGVEFGAERGVIEARTDANLHAAKNGGVDPGFDLRVLAERQGQRRLQALG